jgi:hypothetical protein
MAPTLAARSVVASEGFKVLVRCRGELCHAVMYVVRKVAAGFVLRHQQPRGKIL